MKLMNKLAGCCLALLAILNIGACQKRKVVVLDRAMGEDRWANNLVMWSVAGKYQELLYIIVPGKGEDRPPPDIYLRLKDGTVARLIEMDRAFWNARDDVVYHHLADGKHYYSYSGGGQLRRGKTRNRADSSRCMDRNRAFGGRSLCSSFLPRG